MSVRAGERAAVEILEYMDTEQAYMGQALSEVLHRKNLAGADRGTAVAFSKLTVENRQAVDFAYVFYQLNKAGVRPSKHFAVGRSQDFILVEYRSAGCACECRTL